MDRYVLGVTLAGHEGRVQLDWKANPKVANNPCGIWSCTDTAHWAEMGGHMDNLLGSKMVHWVAFGFDGSVSGLYDYRLKSFCLSS